MASTGPPQASSLSNTPVQVIMVPAHKPRVMRPVPGIKGMSIATIVLALMCLLLGITAAGTKARMSFIGNPIWSAILFMLPCGILGILVHKKRISFCMNISFMVMVILSAMASFQLFIFMICAASNEPTARYKDYEPQDYDYYTSAYKISYKPGCLPFSEPWKYYNGYCTAQSLRIVVDLAITCCALAVGVLNAISFSMTIYGTFSCCYTCCQDSTSTTAANNTSTWIPMRENVPTMMAAPMQHQSSNSYQYTPMIVSPGVGLPKPANQIPQPVYIMQSAPNISTTQPPPYDSSSYQPAPPPSGPSAV